MRNSIKIYFPKGASGWTSPTWNGYITEAYTLFEEEKPSDPVSPAVKLMTAIPTDASVYVNGNSVNFDAYNIADNNYFKLRDLAFILSGSEAQFEIVWDEKAQTISLLSGQPYTPVGNEMASQGTINKVAQLNTSPILLNGRSATFTAYTIDGNNYFKLRDIGAAFDFGIEWDEATQSIMIETDKTYSE